MTKRIGIAGGGKHAWVSVDRTRRFYLDALAEGWELVYINNIEAVNEGAYDLILNFAGNLGWELSGKINCPILYCAHGGAILNQDFLIKELPRLRSCDGIIVNCQSDVDIFKSMCGQVRPNLYKLPLPVNENLFYPIEKREAKDVLGIQDDSIILGHISRLLPQKNLHRFLYMYAEIAKRLKPAKTKALIVGNFWIDYPILDYVTDSYPAYIEKLTEILGITEDVILLPANLTDEELLCCFNALDVLVHPTHSLDENFGYVPVEAMACGVPVLGSAYGGLKDTILDGKTGMLMPTWVTENGIRSDEPSGIQRVAEYLLKPNGEKEACRQDCIAHAHSSFSVKHCTQLLHDFVAQTINNYDTAAIEQVTVHTRPVTLKNTNLPTTPSGTQWTMYYDVVSKYVSQPCPEFLPGTIVYPAYPLQFLGKGKVKLNDPAWPAIYNINGMESLLRNISARGLGYERATEEKISVEQINSWLKSGLLSLTKEKTNA